jgi:hypothetical protein
MKNLLSRLFSRIKPKPLEGEANASLTVGLAFITIKEPISLSKEKPGPSHKDAEGRCLYGFWNKEDDAWEFGLFNYPYDEDTHWLPASSEVTPHKLFRP